MFLLSVFYKGDYFKRFSESVTYGNSQPIAILWQLLHVCQYDSGTSQDQSRIWETYTKPKRKIGAIQILILEPLNSFSQYDEWYASGLNHTVWRLYQNTVFNYRCHLLHVVVGRQKL